MLRSLHTYHTHGSDRHANKVTTWTASAIDYLSTGSPTPSFISPSVAPVETAHLNRPSRVSHPYHNALSRATSGPIAPRNPPASLSFPGSGTDSVLQPRQKSLPILTSHLIVSTKRPLHPGGLSNPFSQKQSTTTSTTNHWVPYLLGIPLQMLECQSPVPNWNPEFLDVHGWDVSQSPRERATNRICETMCVWRMNSPRRPYVRSAGDITRKTIPRKST